MTPILNSAISIVVLFLFYNLLLKRETFFQWNRFFILGSMLIAAIFPWLTLDLPWREHAPEILNTVPVVDHINQDLSVSKVVGDSSFNWYRLILNIYLAGLLLFSLRLLLILGQIVRIYINGKKIKEDNYNLVLVDQPVSPFSFFNQIYLPTRLYQSGKNLEIILNHESVHQRQWHSVDRLLMELFLVYQWFNPLAWLLRKEMIMVHEYLADLYTNRNINAADYQKLLMRNVVPSFIYPIGNGFGAYLRRRFIMMNKPGSPGRNMLKYVFLLPLMIALLFTCTQEELDKISEQANSNRIVGLAIDRETHKPLPGLKIHILGKDQVTRTDGNGVFELQVDDGENIIVAEDKHYKSIRTPLNSDIDKLELWMVSVNNESESQAVFETNYERLSPKIPIKINEDGRIFLRNIPVEIENLENLLRKRRNQLLNGGIDEEEIYASFIVDPRTKMGLLSDLQIILRKVSIKKLMHREGRSEVVEKAQY